MAEELGLGVVPWGPLGQGVLTGKYNGFTPEGAQEALRRVSASADRAEQAEAIDVDTRRAKVALGELDPKNSQVARTSAGFSPPVLRFCQTFHAASAISPTCGRLRKLNVRTWRP